MTLKSETAAPPTVEAPATSPGAVFTRADERSAVVMLDWPLTVDGVYYDKVTIRRMTVEDVAAFASKIADTGRSKFPMFDIPDAVFAHLDADDDEKISEVVERFLPRRFRAKT